MAEPWERDAAQEEHLRAVELCRDVHGGTFRLRDRGTAYLPQMTNEEDDAYDDRKGGSVLYEGFSRTVDGLVGMAFRKDPTLSDDTPAEILEQQEDIDRAGSHVSVFLRDALEDQMVDGKSYLFVDMPAVEEGAVRTLADERAAGLQPYWIRIPRLNVLGHDRERVQGREVTSHFRYLATTFQRNDAGDQVQVNRVRQYEPTGDGRVVWQMWEQVGDQDWDQVVQDRIMTIPEVPLAVAQANRRGRPPLEALAHESILHYRIRSDRTNLISASHVPIFVVTGGELAYVSFGPGVGIELPEGADAKWVEITGSGLAHSKEELQDIRQNMASLGLSQLERQTRQAETARAREIEKAEADSKLSVAVRALRDAADNALRYHALWIGQESTGEIELNTDFDTLMLDWQMVQQLRGMVAEETLSLETLWHRLQKGEVLGDTFDPELERERIRQELNDGLRGAA